MYNLSLIQAPVAEYQSIPSTKKLLLDQMDNRWYCMDAGANTCMSST